MTDNEAKGRLESFIDTFNICKEHDNALVAVSISKEDIQAFTRAIKALEQQPCEDAVSRHDALNCVTGNEVRYRMVNDIRALPSVTPKEKTDAPCEHTCMNCSNYSEHGICNLGHICLDGSEWCPKTE